MLQCDVHYLGFYRKDLEFFPASRPWEMVSDGSRR